MKKILYTSLILELIAIVTFFLKDRLFGLDPFIEDVTGIVKIYTIIILFFSLVSLLSSLFAKINKRVKILIIILNLIIMVLMIYAILLSRAFII